MRRSRYQGRGQEHPGQDGQQRALQTDPDADHCAGDAISQAIKY